MAECDVLRHCGVDGFLAHAMRAMRIAQVTGDEDYLGMKLLEQFTDDPDVVGPDRILAHLAGLVERQVQEPCVVGRESHDFNAADRFRLADDALDVLHFSAVHVTGLLARQERGDALCVFLRVTALDMLVALESRDEVRVASHVVIEDRDVAARHVRHQHRILVFDQLPQHAAHRDHVVIGMRREADHAALAMQLAATADARTQRIEDEPVDRAGRAMHRHQR